MTLKMKTANIVQPVQPIGVASTSKANASSNSSKSFLVRLFGIVKDTSKPGSDRRKQPPIESRGVYFNVTPIDAGNYSTSEPSLSQQTFDSHSSYNSAAPASWVASNELGYNQGVPTIVRRPQYESFNEEDDEKLLKRVLKKAMSLPQESGRYASNHVMINSERVKRSIPPLWRNLSLDAIAREHADLMAASNKLFHAEDPLLLHERILCEAVDVEQSWGRIGENTVRGRTLEEIHTSMMVSPAERNNILDRRYFSMGIGAARAKNGTLYLCQIFIG